MVGAFPAERLAEVGRHYLLFGGKSPINDQCRRLLVALTNELRRRGIQLPLYWGNRNWNPYLDTELGAIDRDGHRRVLAVVTSAYPSYSSCRQYRENLFDAAQGTQVQIDRIRHYANHPGFVQALGGRLPQGTRHVGRTRRRGPLGLCHPFHPDRHGGDRRACTSQPPRRLRRLACGRGLRGRAVASPGIAAEATSTTSSTARAQVPPASHGWSRTSTIICASSLGVRFRQSWWCRSVSCPITWRWSSIWIPRRQPRPRNAAWLSRGPRPPAIIRQFVSGLVDLMVERAAAARGEQPERPVLGSAPVGWYECRADCCPNLREPGRPALCQIAS